MQSAKCCAPPSLRSSRSTDVITTYFKPMSAIARANCRGSSMSRALGLPCATSQNGQRRVQISPMIINVAVPPLKHSPRFGHCASSQTEASLCFRRVCLIRVTSGLIGILTRIQSGFFRNSVVGIILTGIRDTLSAPRNFSPCTTFFGRGLARLVESVVFIGLSLMNL